MKFCFVLLNMKLFLLAAFISFALFSCGPNKNEEALKKMQDSLQLAMLKADSIKAANQQAYYKNREKILNAFYELKIKKGFSFYCVENCMDNSKVYYDAHEDEKRGAHQIGIYRDEDSLYVGFSVFVECYSEFVADIKNENDTLKLSYALMNANYNDCYCNYRWQFGIVNKKSKYEVITLNGKPIRDE